MADYVSRDDVRRFIAEAFSDGHFATNYDYAILSDKIGKLPAADVQPSNRKPIKIYEDEFWVQGFLVQEKYYCCPNCEKVLGNLRAHDVHDLINEYKFCSECGQGLDWNEIKEIITK